MNNIELLKQLVKRLKKFSWLIAVIALLFGGLFFYMARQSVVQWSSKATVFPLSASNTSSTGSAISNLLGLTDAPKSFTEDASINIVELANSRRTREAVAMERIPSMKNKTISELLIEENNRYTGFMQNEKIDTPPRQPGTGERGQQPAEDLFLGQDQQERHPGTFFYEQQSETGAGDQLYLY